MVRISFSAVLALCMLASMLGSASAACSMFKYPRQYIKPAKDDAGKWLFASYAQTRTEDTNPKYCLDKCTKDSSTY